MLKNHQSDDVPHDSLRKCQEITILSNKVVVWSVQSHDNVEGVQDSGLISDPAQVSGGHVDHLRKESHLMYREHRQPDLSEPRFSNSQYIEQNDGR